MHPEPSHHDVVRDPILDGRDSLRLVKLRLALTLITVAILPIAAVSPLVRAAADEARMAHHQRLETVAGVVAQNVEQELDAIVGAASKLLADPKVAAADASGASSAARAAASARLADLVKRDSGAVTGVTVLDDSSVRTAYGASLDQTWLPDGPAAPGVFRTAGPDADSSLLLVVILPEPARPNHLALVASVSLPPLVGWAAHAQAIPGQNVRLLDADGSAIVSVDASFDALG